MYRLNKKTNDFALFRTCMTAIGLHACQAANTYISIFIVDIFKLNRKSYRKAKTCAQSFL